MTPDIVHRLGEIMNRRAFLRRIASAAASAAGLSQLFASPALALYQCRCCTLYRPCQLTPCTGCACTWTWSCVDQNNVVWRCHECYSSTAGGCNGGEQYVICSWAERTGLGPQAAII